jgi:hypothetical protein
MDLGDMDYGVSGMYNYSAAFVRSRAAYDELALPRSIESIVGPAFSNGTIEGIASHGARDYSKDVY